MVCAARAEIHAHPTLRDFEDPYAEALLPPWYTVHDTQSGRRLFARGLRRLSRVAAHLIALRTVAIDDAIRSAPSFEQFVILGAGLDARAWRMPELEGKDIFEIDHPATQTYKRERAAAFGAARGRHRYVDVDFERQSLAQRLQESGHRADAPTMWVWEGVVMYLFPQAVEQTLSVVAERSAPQSRLAVTYLPPSVGRTLVGVATALFSERLRATYEPAELASLMSRVGLELVSDTDGADWHDRWALESAHVFPGGLGNVERLAVADRV